MLIISDLTSRQLSPSLSNQSLGPMCNIFSVRQPKTCLKDGHCHNYRPHLRSLIPEECLFLFLIYLKCIPQREYITSVSLRFVEERPLTENMFQYNQESKIGKSTACQVTGSPSTNMYQLPDLRYFIQPLWP